MTIDLNHPLAGCTLNFVGQVLANREATKEEMAQSAQGYEVLARAVAVIATAAAVVVKATAKKVSGGGWAKAVDTAIKRSSDFSRRL